MQCTVHFQELYLEGKWAKGASAWKYDASFKKHHQITALERER